MALTTPLYWFAACVVTVSCGAAADAVPQDVAVADVIREAQQVRLAPYGDSAKRSALFKRVKDAIEAADTPASERSRLKYYSLYLERSGPLPQSADELATLERLSADGVVEAIHDVGVSKLYGIYTERESGEGAKLLESAYDGGDPVAATSMGIANLLGVRPFTEDLAKAEQYLNEGRKRGDVSAHLALASCKRSLLRHAEALQHYKDGAEAGDARCAFALGRSYATGDGAEVDYAAARRHFEEAATLGHPIAMVKLAAAYQRGVGGERNDAAALALYERAADQGIRSARHIVAMSRVTGYLGGAIDREAGLRELERLADEGFPQSQYDLGRMLFEGDGVPPDARKGIKLLREAARNGIDNAAAYLEIMSVSLQDDRAEAQF